MTTRKLSNTLSACLGNPYLLHHAHNPVHWMPWGPAAHQLAKQLHRPIFLSIGYTACHWCHVMAQESFENDEIAQLLNEYFINIKVDKEERPDVDRLYMTYVQATTGSGGWPLTVFLTPDLQPFVGGSYFPPEEKWGQTGLKTLIRRIHKAWTEDSRTIEMKASNIFNMLKSTLVGQSDVLSKTSVQSISLSDLTHRLFELFTQRFRKEYGGFSDAPLFPLPSELQSLFALSSTGSLNKQEKKQTLSMVLHTLRKMSQGGIHDHIGGGFSRYSVDECWHVPHFEKMLYDNAQLLQSFVSAYRASNDTYFLHLGNDIFDYIKRDMRHTTGAFYSSQDADSLPGFDSGEPKEGAYYTYTRQEVVDQIAGINGDIFCFHYNIMEGGNCNLSVRSDPHKEFQGTNVPIELSDDPLGQTARHFQKTRNEIENVLANGRRLLFEYRQKTRPAPITDDKILTAWNAMMISACAQAHCVFVLGRKRGDSEQMDFLQVATQAMNALECSSFVQDGITGNKKLLRSIRYVKDEVVQGPAAFADDYVWMISAYLDLYQASGNHVYIERALSIQHLMDAKFNNNTCYLSSDSNDDSSVLIQFPEMNDGAEPSPNSVAAANLYRLRDIVDYHDGEKYSEMAKSIMDWALPTVTDVPFAMPLLVANNIIFDSNLDMLVKVVLVARESDDDVQVKDFLHELWSRNLPALSITCITSNDAYNYFSQVNSIVKAMAYPPLDGKPELHLCVGSKCYPPIVEPSELGQALDDLLSKYV